MVNSTILIVEDEPAIREMVNMALTQAGFNLLESCDGQEALAVVSNQVPQLILLDWMLPDMSGLDLARRLKRTETTQDIPIIMLTARSEENDKIRGLESGTDDYITKPFSTRELVARIKAVLRRYSASFQQTLDFDGLKLDPNTHRVTIESEEVNMGPTEFRLLHFFMTHPERVYSRDQLISQVWGGNVYIDERTVDVHIRRLRKALKNRDFDRMVQTVRGVGYRFSNKI